MKFQLRHCRATQGNDVFVAVQAEVGEVIESVSTVLDGFSLAEDPLDPPTVAYENEWHQAGDAAPLTEHNLEVTATDGKGRATIATHRWTDSV
jgi:hypothetical protein